MALKMKRKDLDDEFSDFSLFSPASKMRRLDAELPPIIEEEESVRPIFEESMSEMSFSSNVERLRGPVIEELPSEPSNEERAIVLFKPMTAPPLQSPSNFSVRVSSDLISGFKNQLLWSNQYNIPMELAQDEDATRENSGAGTKESLAVIPWNPSQLPQTQNAVPLAEISELMEAEDETEATSMEIEENNSIIGLRHEEGVGFGGTSVQQWQQQHCMFPQIPPNTSTPIVWYGQ